MRVLELNDAGLRLCDGQSVIVESPGLAALHDRKLLTGSAARARKRIDPRRSHDRFWYQLDAGLDRAMAEARSAADLAHRQLVDIGAPLSEADLLVAAPGTYTAGQLSLALGLLKAAGARVQGLFDPAVAAARTLTDTARVIHVDVQLHRFCITLLSGGQTLEILDLVEHKPGLAVIEDRLAEAFAAAFVRQSRFDPLHDATTEQRLYDAMPSWLASLSLAPSMVCDLDLGPRRVRAGVEATALKQALSGALDVLAERLNKHLQAGQTSVLLSDRAAAIPGLAGYWPEATCLTPVEMAKRAIEVAQDIVGDPQQLPWVRRLPARTTGTGTTRIASTPEPTHVLLDAHAHALNGQSPSPLATWLPGAPGVICREQGVWQLIDVNSEHVRINGAGSGKPATLRIGDLIEHAGRQIQLIRVEPAS